MTTSIDTQFLQRCIQALDRALQLLQNSPKDSIEYEMYRSACIKEFEIILEQSGKLLKKVNVPEDQIIEQFNIAVKANKTWKNIDKLLPLYLRSESDLYNEIENIYGKDVAKQSIQGINEIENKISNFKLPSKEQEITTPEDIAKFKSLIKENIFLK